LHSLQEPFLGGNIQQAAPVPLTSSAAAEESVGENILANDVGISDSAITSPGACERPKHCINMGLHFPVLLFFPCVAALNVYILCDRTTSCLCAGPKELGNASWGLGAGNAADQEGAGIDPEGADGGDVNQVRNFIICLLTSLLVLSADSRQSNFRMWARIIWHRKRESQMRRWSDILTVLVCRAFSTAATLA
jgi:hypothetical protein